MLLVPSLAITIGGIFLYMGGVVASQPYNGYLGLNYLATEDRYVGLGLFLIGLGVLWAIVCLLEFYRRQTEKPVQVLGTLVPELAR